jgi:endonuclease/exonuclease/phosphatase family metal-dependent hydrolase
LTLGSRRRRVFVLFPFFLILVTAGCAGGYGLVRRDPAELPFGPPSDVITWHTPAAPSDAARLARWRAGVGPPVVQAPPADNTSAADAVTIVGWNIALGAADIAGLASALPNSGGPTVLLLQEVVRGGPEVPSRLPPGTGFGRRHGGAAGGTGFREIEAVASALGFGVYYVPSMRNGPASASDEDRGNAILSNLPLTGLMAIELPFERQRRVAIAATIAGRTTTGAPWRLRVVSAHLDNIGGAKRAYLAAEYGRTRQVRGLLTVLAGSEPTILAGDFNTWFGFLDRAYIELAGAFPETRMVDRRRTFHGLLRLDHVFYRLAPGWRAEFRLAAGRFGSDHYPMVGTVRFR